MASAQVDVVHVEDLTKSSEETTLGSPTIEAPAKAPAAQNIESPYDEDEDNDEVALPDELGDEDHLDDKENKKPLEPQIIDDEDGEDDENDENAEDDEPALKSTRRATDFSEEEGDEDEE